jgi:glycosyltransferase involved in cell wall biosynthesis
LAGKLMGIKTRIYFNHGVPFLAYTGIKQKFLKFIEALNLILATEVITVSPDMRRALMQVGKSKKISLISNGSACGIDLALFNQNHGSHSDFLLEYGLSEKDCIVTYIGRPEVRKGFLVALAVWEKHFQDKEAYKLIMCGPTNQDVIDAFGRIPKNVYCLGFVKNIPRILFFSEYLILPSFHEGLSYAVLEAMASKTIVIANDIQGIRCLVEDGINGFLVQDNDVDQFAQELTLLSQQPVSFTNGIKEAGLKTANLYSRARFLEAYSDYLRQFD